MPVGSVARLQAGDITQLEALLRANRLPSDDCVEQARHFCGIFDGDKLIAAGGLEPAANNALLRSVVVDEACRGRGLARKICEHLLTRARLEGRVAVYLLTENAASYFEKIGFKRVARDVVPAAITQTRQFASLCPDSAACLVLNLGTLLPDGTA